MNKQQEQSTAITEQRQEYRLHNQLTVIIELDSGDAGEPLLVVSHSLDVSANGLRVIAPSLVPPNNILRCCIRDDQGDRQFLVVSEVKWCQPYELTSDYLVGLSLFDSEGTDIQQWKEFIAQCCTSA